MPDPRSSHRVEGPAKGRPSGDPVVKVLFAASGNICAYSAPEFNRPGCETRLYEPGWTSVQALICHIVGFNVGSCRHDPTLSVKELNHYDNLLLLCPTHSRLVDNLECERHTVDVLREMKRRHEQANGQSDFGLNAAQIEQVATFITLLAIERGLWPRAGGMEATLSGGGSVQATGSTSDRADSHGQEPPDGGGVLLTENGELLTTESAEPIAIESDADFFPEGADTDLGAL